MKYEEKKIMDNELVVLTAPQLRQLIKQVIAETNNSPKQPVSEDDVYLTAKEVQKFLKIGHSTIHRFINSGKLSPVRFGRKLLFKKSDLLMDTKNNTATAKKSK